MSYLLILIINLLVTCSIARISIVPPTSLQPQISVADSSDEACRRADKLLIQGHYKEAITEYDRALELGRRAEAPAYLSGRGRAYALLGNYALANADFKRGIEIVEATAARLYENLGDSCFQQGQYDKANQYATKAIAFGSQAMGYCNRGEALFKLGKFTEALDDLNKAIILLPAFGEAFYYRALVHEALGDKVSAAQDRAEATKLNYVAGQSTTLPLGD